MNGSDKHFGCWASHKFNSREGICTHSTSLGIVNRKMAICEKRQEFRHYRNARGLDRILMMDADYDSDNCHDYFMPFITDGDFFYGFCEGMLEHGEITQLECDLLKNGLDKLGVKYTIKEKPKDKLSENDLDELNSL